MFTQFHDLERSQYIVDLKYLKTQWLVCWNSMSIVPSSVEGWLISRVGRICFGLWEMNLAGIRGRVRCYPHRDRLTKKLNMSYHTKFSLLMESS